MALRTFGILCFLAALHCFSAARPEKQRLKLTNANGNTVSVNESVLVMDVGLDELVGQGWGSRVLYMGAMQGQFTNDRKDRKVTMPQETYETYTKFDLHPPFATLADEAFGSMLADVSHPDVADMQMNTGRKEGDQQMNRWADQQFARVYYHGALRGCWENFDSFISKMFEQVIAKHEKPFDDYLGMHVRHGDKVEEGAIIDLSSVMEVVQNTPHWKNMRNFFVATDDLNVLQKEVNQYHAPEGDDYAWNWTISRHRHAGGEPDTCSRGHCHHDNNAGSIKAVLDDTVSLAHASVLVGNFNSNFFKLPWLLNYLRRTPEQRRENWCWDLFTKQPCHDRSEFSLGFTRKVNGGVGFSRNDTDLLRACANPTLEENQ